MIQVPIRPVRLRTLPEACVDRMHQQPRVKLIVRPMPRSLQSCQGSEVAIRYWPLLPHLGALLRRLLSFFEKEAKRRTTIFQVLLL